MGSQYLPSYGSGYLGTQDEDDPLLRYAQMQSDPLGGMQLMPESKPPESAAMYSGGAGDDIPQAPPKNVLAGPYTPGTSGEDYGFQLQAPGMLGDRNQPLYDMIADEGPKGIALKQEVAAQSPGGAQAYNTDDGGGGFADATKDPTRQAMEQAQQASLARYMKGVNGEDTNVWDALGAAAPGLVGAGLSAAFSRGRTENLDLGNGLRVPVQVGAHDPSAGLQAAAQGVDQMQRQKAQETQQAGQMAVQLQKSLAERNATDPRVLAMREKALQVQRDREDRIAGGQTAQHSTEGAELQQIQQNMVQAGWDPALVQGKSRADLLQMAKTPPPNVAQQRAAAQRTGAIGAEVAAAPQTQQAAVDKAVALQTATAPLENQQAVDRAQQMAPIQNGAAIDRARALAPIQNQAAVDRATALAPVQNDAALQRQAAMDAQKLGTAPAAPGAAPAGPPAIPGSQVDDPVAYSRYLKASSGNLDKVTQTVSAFDAMRTGMSEMAKLRSDNGTVTGNAEVEAKYNQLKSSVISGASTLYHTGVLSKQEWERYSAELPDITSRGWGDRAAAMMPGGPSPTDDPIAGRLSGQLSGLDTIIGTKLKSYGLSMPRAGGGIARPTNMPQQAPTNDPLSRWTQ